MGLANAIKKIAAKQLKNFGVEITFTQEIEGSYDSVNDEDLTATTQVFTGYGYTENYSKYNLNGTTIKKGDVKLMLEATNIIPLVGAVASVNGLGNFEVIDVESVFINEDIVNYTLQLRK